MKSAYGEFCSNHMDGVELYKVTNYGAFLARCLLEVLFASYICFVRSNKRSGVLCLRRTPNHKSCPFLFCFEVWKRCGVLI